MTDGGHVGGPASRLRIKGRWQSVVRFFSISAAFMVLWILVTSQLGHFSKLFGPQILLQLNLAFYLPSIPVLLLSGSLEKALDQRLGPITSLTLRLNSGLAGCLTLAALFPLLPGLRPGDGPLWPLLAAVGLLGGASAVAFSTSYQLVQYFRAADTIGLGVGCVGAGPLVLMMQLALGVGSSPARWQWIAMYEISAGLIAAGLISSTSLCGQYWKRLHDAATRHRSAAAAATDEEGEHRVPLLAAVAEDNGAGAGTEADVDNAEAGLRGLRLRSAATAGGYGSPQSPYGSPGFLRPLCTAGAQVRLSRGGGGGRVVGRPRRGPTTAPDPFNIFSLLSPGLDGGWGMDDDDEDSAPPVLLRRSASVGVEDSTRSAAAAQRRRQALVAVGLDRSTLRRTRPRTGPSAAADSGLTTTTTTLYSQYAGALTNAKPGIPASLPVKNDLLPASGMAPEGVVAAGNGPDAGVVTELPVVLSLWGINSAPAKMVRHENTHGGKCQEATAEDDVDINADDVVPRVLEFGLPDDESVVQNHATADVTMPTIAAHHQHWPSHGASVSSFASVTASEILVKALGLPATEPNLTSSVSSLSLAACTADAASSVSMAAPNVGGAQAVAAADASSCGVVALPKLKSVEAAEGVSITLQPDGKEQGEREAPLTLSQEVIQVVRGCWQVMLGFTVDVTLLYVVFPFFTYVPTSGWLGDNLPQVLFYSRLFTDLVGRLLPRRRALQLRSGTAILALSSAATSAAALFFVYILAPPQLVARAPRLFRNDAVPLGLVVFLWLTGGYTNTMSNMLAPSLVPPPLAGRASALMALAFNVAHIGGLLIAAAMAAAIFGDMVG